MATSSGRLDSCIVITHLLLSDQGAGNEAAGGMRAFSRAAVGMLAAIHHLALKYRLVAIGMHARVQLDCSWHACSYTSFGSSLSDVAIRLHARVQQHCSWLAGSTHHLDHHEQLLQLMRSTRLQSSHLEAA